ncbi:MAG: VTT domain-containing protein [Anaerolineales bacterium]|nr:VTT domain-containing protein [Anaerolineales bacterium]MBP8163866.1 VTT domain-containing protein [Anaerolineales bacterium]
MSEFLLTQVINYGTPLIGLILFLGALGFPVGASVVVIAAGAFGQQGILDVPTAALLGLIGAVAGDALSFGMGHYAKDAVQRRFGKSPAWRNARVSFQKRAGLAVYLTRWLVTAVAIPTNLIAGGSGYKFSHFIAYDLAGEMTWIALYGGLGYWFGSQWELVYDFMSNFGGLILGLVIFGFGIRQAWNWQKSKSN